MFKKQIRDVACYYLDVRKYTHVHFYALLRSTLCDAVFHIGPETRILFRYIFRKCQNQTKTGTLELNLKNIYDFLKTYYFHISLEG